MKATPITPTPDVAKFRAVTRHERWSAVVDLGGTKMALARVDGLDSLRGVVREPTGDDPSVDAVVESIVQSVHGLRESPDDVPVGVGVGVAGQVNPAGVVRLAPNIGWREVPLAQLLQDRLQTRVKVVNDVFAATWGEWKCGAGRGCDNLVCIFVGTGIGGGVIASGREVTGHDHGAGEVGHMVIDWQGQRECRCGHRGCWESWAGGWAIAERAQEAIAAGEAGADDLLGLAGGAADAVTAELVAKEYHRGNELARRLVAETREVMVDGVASIVNLLNPARVILGGGVIQGLPELVGWIDEGVRDRALPMAVGNLEVVAAELGGEAGLIGMAAMLRDDLAESGNS